MSNNYNNYLDRIDITSESGYPQEPVAIQQVKDYLRIEGFVDADESTTEALSDFEYDDALIADMIVAARRKAEKYCGCSFVFHTWKVLLTNCAGDIELPMGPVREFTQLLDCNDTEIESGSYKLRGFSFMFLECPKQENLTLIYDAGYEDCPEEVCLAIMQMVGYWYENRVVGEMPKLAMNTLMAYKRPWTYVG